MVDKTLAQKVLQDNSYWAHAENLVISMLGDEREEIRRKAVLWILRARREFDSLKHPRKFIPPSVNFQVYRNIFYTYCVFPHNLGIYCLGSDRNILI